MPETLARARYLHSTPEKMILVLVFAGYDNKTTFLPTKKKQRRVVLNFRATAKII